MTFSRRFINFAAFLCIITLLFGLSACKGRTMENMEPSGDTVEVVILQTENEQSNNL